MKIWIVSMECAGIVEAGGGQSLKKNAASDEEKALDLLNQLKSIFSEQ